LASPQFPQTACNGPWVADGTTGLRPIRASFSPEFQPGFAVSSGGRKPADGTGIVSRRGQMQVVQPPSFPDVEASDYISGGGLSLEVALT